MRIAIPTDDEKQIAAHTGRCLGFAIYSIEGDRTQKLEYRRFESAHHSQEHSRHGDNHGAHDCSHGRHGDSGHSHHGLLEAVRDCGVFLAMGMGPRLVNDLQAHGLMVVFTLERDIVKAVEALALGRLVENPSGSACHRH
jgi:predicted Fe-Mo cluster-binding NifX family protein